jgi:hypothetical protein
MGVLGSNVPRFTLYEHTWAASLTFRFWMRDGASGTKLRQRRTPDKFIVQCQKLTYAGMIKSLMIKGSCLADPPLYRFADIDV